jgi:hypothetical protein
LAQTQALAHADRALSYILLTGAAPLLFAGGPHEVSPCAFLFAVLATMLLVAQSQPVVDT